MGHTDKWEQTGHGDPAPLEHAGSPCERHHDASEALVHALAHALHASGAVETMHAYSVHPVDGYGETQAFVEQCSIAAVRLQVHHEDRWRDVVLSVAGAVRAVPGINLVVSFAQPGELRLEVFPWFSGAQRRLLLERALREAVQAVHHWCQRMERPGAG